VVLELYSGAGLLTAALAERVGVSGRVVGLEASKGAVTDAAANLRDLPWAEVRTGPVTAASVAALNVDADLIVLDPPRSGAGAAVMTTILSGQARAVCYVACDPAALARDVRTALELGWRLSGLRAIDAFPMTHHVECIARLEPVLAGDSEIDLNDTGSGEAPGSWNP
jgi:tRNA/tmRNA/rRNA uracil-C5-methylase (TrmA/RlmC/RlmD family)